MAVLVFYWFRNLKQTPRWIFACLAVFSGTALLLVLAALVVGFPFWGRHFAPVFPAFVAVAGWIFCLCWRAPSLAIKISALTLLLLLLASSLMLRFAPMHAKDDYRSAAALALETVNESGTIWWAADPAGANYYGIFPALSTAAAAAGEKNVILVSNMTYEQLSGLPYPQMLVVSKPDLYDSFGHLLSARAATGLHLFKTLPGFTLWRRR